MSKAACLTTEIARLREQLHHVYHRDKRVSEAVLNVSVKLDRLINAYNNITPKEIVPRSGGGAGRHVEIACRICQRKGGDCPPPSQ